MTISSSRDKIRYIRGLHLYQTCQIFLADFSRLSRQRVEATMAVLLRPRGLPNRWRQIETQSRRHQVPTCYTWNVQSSFVCNIYSKDLGCWGEWEEVWRHKKHKKHEEQLVITCVRCHLIPGDEKQQVGLCQQQSWRDILFDVRKLRSKTKKRTFKKNQLFRVILTFSTLPRHVKAFWGWSHPMHLITSWSSRPLWFWAQCEANDDHVTKWWLCVRIQNWMCCKDLMLLLRF